MDASSDSGNHDSRDDQAFARNVDWNLFRDFLAIARHGGVGAAARATGRQQPSLSAALKRLEEHLGQILAHRGTKGITLTQAGLAMAALCETVFGQVLSMPHRAAAAAGMLEGVVRIRMMSDVICPPLDAAMPAFHARYPKMHIKLDIAPWRDVVVAVADGSADIGFACDSVPSDDLRYLPIAAETQQLYCAKASSLFGNAPQPPHDFAGQDFVLTGRDEPDELTVFRRRYGLGRQVGGTADTLQEVRRLIELGFGIGFLPTIVAEPHVQIGTLWPLLPEELLPSYSVYMIVRADLVQGAPASLLMDMIVQAGEHS